ncbi:MAG: cation-translocating P-type ATPase [Chloroflexi bacterium]|nr:cation-translocating P-type ATPase [Chloroflexota bacterium]
MDCAECTQHVRQAIAAVPGVSAVDVLLATEKAVVRLDPVRADRQAIARAVEGAGYKVPADRQAETRAFGRSVSRLFGVLVIAILALVVAGEWLGVFDWLTARLPWPVGLAAVLIGGFPVFHNVIRAALRRQVIAHTLMTVGVIAAMLVGEWATALVVVVLMRVGDYVERFTASHARSAVRDLMAMAPQQARVERDGQEIDVPADSVQAGEIVIVRPGEQIPVDGVIVSGQATVNQAAITGESMPVETGPGERVFAASLAELGSLRVRTTHAGRDSTFGRVVHLVEQAETSRSDVQRMADRFSAWFLPIVAGVAALTFLLRRDPLAVAAVLVVACSCSIALATPIAMLASVGAAAGRGLLIKGGKHLETLARADVLLIDKTGTLTLGRPQLTDVVPLDGMDPDELLQLAASAERFSEHPLAHAVRAAATAKGIAFLEPADFEALPGLGVRCTLSGSLVSVGSERLVGAPTDEARLASLLEGGKTLLYVERDARLAGVLAAADALRPEVPEALAEVRQLGIRQIELLTGDAERTAAALAASLGIPHRAQLMPADKIAIVRGYQAQGHRVIMIGDGVNDAPALAQEDVGIAMGAAGSDIALQAAHVALLRDDWRLVPEVLRIARRTMSVVRLNIAFTAVYNTVGLTLAALGILPPVLAAAAQSIPDLGILANSSRLLRQR